MANVAFETSLYRVEVLDDNHPLKEAGMNYAIILKKFEVEEIHTETLWSAYKSVEQLEELLSPYLRPQLSLVEKDGETTH